MQQIFHIKIDTEKMSVEELQIVKKEIRKLLSTIEFQIRLKKMSTRNSSK